MKESYDSIINMLTAADTVEREQRLSEYVVGKFKSLLLIEDDEDLSFDQNYFDLGLTSLQIEQLKQEIEADFETAINPAVFFNNPTIYGLIAHLRDQILNPLAVDVPPAGREPLQPFTENSGTADFNEREVVDGVLGSLLKRA